MKKIIKAFLPLVFSAVLFTGCYDAVFQSIRKEVALEDAEVSGFINNIVRFRSNHETVDAAGNPIVREDEFLTLPCGIIYSKQITNGDLSDLTYNEAHGKWFKNQGGLNPLSYDYFASEFNGEYVTQLASDYDTGSSKETLYALTVLYEKYDTKGRNVPKSFKLYTKNEIEAKWTAGNAKIQAAINNHFSACDKDKYGTDVTIQLFCTNTPKRENRRTFIKIGEGDSKIWFKAETAAGVEVEVNSIIYELHNNAPAATPYYYKREKTSTGYKYDVVSESTGYAEATLSNKVQSAVIMDGTVYFFPFLASIGNDTKSSDADIIYLGKGTKAYWFNTADFAACSSVETNNKDEDGNYLSFHQMVAFFHDFKDKAGKSIEKPATLHEIDLSSKKSIVSIAKTSNDVLFGSKGNGVFRATIESDKSLKKTTSFIKNTNDILCSPYNVKVLFTVDPSLEAGNASQYAVLDFNYTASSSGANYNNRGLWSFYKSRENWNKE